ncbi:MAG: transporter substrate-binding domain-containing protein [Spirochaetia bacterium]|nr:transporter substrate-binding domain-containing protein [Spirochaetia bacterium]
MRRKTIVVVALLIAACAVSAWADEIVFGFRPVPPYVMIDAAGKFSGLEYEIIVAALAVKGHTVKPQQMPLARLVATFNEGGIKGAAPVLATTATTGTLSVSYITYNNVAMGLKAAGLKIEKIADLKGLGIVAFQTATKALGPDFAAAVEGNPKYVEEAAQITQIRMLVGKRVDVVIGESRILNYYLKAPETGVDSGTPVVEFRIFNPTNYSVAFANPKHAEDFNAGLAEIKKNGTYDAIMKKYVK